MVATNRDDVKYIYSLGGREKEGGREREFVGGRVGSK